MKSVTRKLIQTPKIIHKSMLDRTAYTLIKDYVKEPIVRRLWDDLESDLR